MPEQMPVDSGFFQKGCAGLYHRADLGTAERDSGFLCEMGLQPGNL